MKKPKEKGRRAELAWAKMIVDAGLDPNAKRMPLSGAVNGLDSKESRILEAFRVL